MNYKRFLAILTFLLSGLSLLAQDLTPKLKGIIFHSSVKAVLPEGVTDSSQAGIQFIGVNPPEQTALTAKLEAHLGKKTTKKDLDKMVNEIILHYREANYPVVDIFTPPQAVKNGIIQMVALESTLDELTIEGNKHFSSQQIEKFLNLKSGDSINQDELNVRLNQLNKNPYRTVDVSYEEGNKPKTTNAIVKVDDSLPLKYTLGFDDSGNALTEDERISASFNWGNVFNTGHVFNYTYSGDPLAKYLKSNSVSYSINFPWGHDLTLSGNYARNGADLPDPALNVAGKSLGGGINYSLGLPPLPFLEEYTQSLVLGYNFSRSNNLLEFNQIQVSNTITDTSELKLTYNGSMPDKYGMTIFSTTITYSPGDTTGHNTSRELRASGASSSTYAYTLFNLNRITVLPQKWMTNTTIQYQMATENLPGGGKLGAGGYLTLPGYDEREANGDRGLILLQDITTPPVSPSSYFKKEWGDQLTGRIFWGYSDVSVKQINATTLNPHISMMSVGTGFRYNVGTNVSFRFDYGWQLKDSGVSSLTRRTDNSRGHFALSVSY